MSWKDYECPICGTTGFTWVDGNSIKLCKCVTKRNALRRLEESGLSKAFERCTFESFEVKEPWQQRMVDVSTKYVNEGAKDGKWLYIGGQSGSGKTHIATAVLSKLAEKDDIIYMPWTIETQALKSVITDDTKYEERIKPLMKVWALFIDDLFKPTRGADGYQQVASAADVRIAFDILNYRYLNDLPTIISSEWHSRELDVVDEAISSRIYEMCNGYRINIGRDSSRNHRYREDELI